VFDPISVRPRVSVLSAPNLVALATGGACFWLLYQYVLPAYLYFESALPASETLGVLLFFALFLLPAVLAGLIALRAPIMHGVLLGALACILALARPVPAPPVPMPPFNLAIAIWTLSAVVLCPLGAVLGVNLGRLRRGL
jgi:hypothetical protein